MIGYYLQLPNDSNQLGQMLWRVSQNTADRLDIFDASGMYHYEGTSAEALINILKENYPLTTFYKLILEPGEYFPRMARPSSISDSPGQNPDKSPSFRDARAVSAGQLHALIEQLQSVFRVVHPIEDNFQTFGHEIRNILILACTEVEAHWKNILLANGKRAGTKLSTYGYLNAAMRLEEYRVAFPWYPWIRKSYPFSGWEANKTLAWYIAYNKVKHDRESQFKEATLKHALTAVAACFVMLCAQYGWDFARSGELGSREFFQLKEAPKWGPHEIYTDTHSTTGYRPRKYFKH